MSTQNIHSTLNLIPHKMPTYLPWLVVFSASLFFFYEFIQMQMFNTISHYLLDDFKISATALGYISSGYFLADVLFLFPAGIIIDRFSSRGVILAAMWVSVISTFIFSITHSIVLATICHFAAGIGNAFCFITCMRLASRWFPPRLLALVIGLIVTMAMLGGVVAQTPLAYLTKVMGWREALAMVAAFGLLIIAVIWRYVQDYPKGEEVAIEQQRKTLQTLGVKDSVMQALKNLQNWSCGFYTSFTNVPLMLLGGLWGNLYLTTTYGLTQIQASYASSMIFFGTMVGCPLIGAISDRMGLRKAPMIVFALLSLPVMWVIVSVPHLSLHIILLLFFGLGFLTSSQTLGYPVVSESNPKMITATALGLASFLIMAAPLVFEPLFGYLMDKNWDGKMVNGTHIYSAAAFHLPMLMLLGILLVGFLCSFLVKETYAKDVYHA